MDNRVKYDLNDPVTYKGFAIIAKRVNGQHRFKTALDYFHRNGFPKMTRSGLYSAYKTALRRSNALRINDNRYKYKDTVAKKNKKNSDKTVEDLKHQLQVCQAKLQSYQQLTRVGVGMNLHKQKFYLYAYVGSNQMAPKYALEDNGLGVRMTDNLKQSYSGKNEQPNQSYKNYIAQQKKIKAQKIQRKKKQIQRKQDQQRRIQQRKQFQQEQQQKKLQQQRAKKQKEQKRQEQIKLQKQFKQHQQQQKQYRQWQAWQQRKQANQQRQAQARQYYRNNQNRQNIQQNYQNRYPNNYYYGNYQQSYNQNGYYRNNNGNYYYPNNQRNNPRQR